MYRKFIRRTLLGFLLSIGCWMAFIIAVDPFFHYHAPLFGMKPVVNNERYQNPGIADHFEYDSMILGSSMAENFRASWFDEAFGCSTVKLPYSAARTAAYGWMLEKGFSSRSMKNVFLGLDTASLCTRHGTYTFPLPEYLYDANPFNDMEYLCNMDVLEAAVEMIQANRDGTVASMDDAYVWDRPGLYGKEQALASVNWDMLRQESQRDCSTYLKYCRENLEKDILPYVAAHPETQFYIFFPPYSVLQWNLMWNRGELDARLDATDLTIELLLPYPNVKLFFFQNDREVVCNLENYKDYNHYSAEISREMVSWMKEGKGLVTKENKDDLLRDMRELALGYDYAALLK